MRPYFISLRPAHLPQAPFAYAPLLRFAVSVGGGMACGWLLRDEVSSAWWFVAFLSLCLMLLLTLVAAWCQRLLRKQGREAARHCLATQSERYFFFQSTLCFLILATLAANRLTVVYEQTLTDWPDEVRTWRANVDKVERVYEGKTVTLTATLTPLHVDFAGKQVTLYIQGAEPDSLTPGTTILFRARITNHFVSNYPGTFDRSVYSLTHGISGRAYVSARQWVRSVTPDAPDFTHRLLRLRHQLVQRLSGYLHGDQLAILSALALGDKSRLHAEIRRPFQETGTSHILALSGLHLSILFYLIQFLLIRPLRSPVWRRVGQGLALVMLWLFVMLAGSPLSLQRAASMLTILQIGLCFHRGYHPTLNNLALSALLILWVSPLSLLDVGFQLSFASVLSIALMNRYVWNLHLLPKWEDRPDMLHLLTWLSRPTLRQRLYLARYRLARSGYRLLTATIVPFFTISLSAQLGTAPLVAYYFHQLPLYGLVANVLVIPLAFLLLSGSLLFFLIPCEAVAAPVARLLSLALDFLTEGLEWLSSLPGGNFEVYLHPLTLVVFTLSLFALWHYIHGPRRLRLRFIAVTGSLLIAALVTELYSHRPQRLSPQLIVYRFPQSYAVHFIASADDSYLLAPTDSLHAPAAWSRIEADFWKPNGIRFPQFIRQTHFRTPALQRADRLFAFCGQRVWWFDRTYTTEQLRHLPQASLWFVDKGCKLEPQQLLKHRPPHQVVLLPALPSWQVRRWQEACQAHGIACHNLRREGMFRYYLPLTHP